MTIVFIIDTYTPTSGGSIATIRLVEELKKRGHDIKVVTAAHDGSNTHNIYKVAGFQFPFGRKIQSDMNFLFGRIDKNILRKAIHKADIVQVQFPFLLGKGAVEIANELGIPVIGSFHVQPQNLLYAIVKPYKLYENMCWFLFKYFLYNRVETIISPSVFATNLLISKGVSANHVSISNGIPPEYAVKSIKAPTWFNNKFVIISIGRLANEKKFSLLIRAIKNSIYSNEIQLIIGGKGELEKKLKALGESLPIKPLIEYISEEDKIKYLNTADLYIHTSVIELESLSTSEAIGCGLPCLISNSNDSAASQFAIDERFLFEKDDCIDLTNKINYWFENRIELKSNSLKEKVEDLAKKYRFKNCVDKYEAVYQNIAMKNSVHNEGKP